MNNSVPNCTKSTSIGCFPKESVLVTFLPHIVNNPASEISVLQQLGHTREKDFFVVLAVFT